MSTGWARLRLSRRQQGRFSPAVGRAKTLFTAVLVVAGSPVVGAFTASPVAAQVVTHRIMPLGDSITAGVGMAEKGGYRVNLEDKLVAGGYSFDFVGSLLNGPASLADKNHQGHGGYTIQQVSDAVNSWLAASPSSVVLLPENPPGTSTARPVIALNAEMIGLRPDLAIGTFSSSDRVCARAELICGLPR